MAFAFDTLGYAKRLRDAGVPEAEAEAHAEAARGFIMTELVTRLDLDVARRELEGSIAGVRHHVDTSVALLSQRIDSAIDLLRQHVDDSGQALRQHVDDSGQALRQHVDLAIAASEQRANARMDRLGLRLAIQFGGALAVAVGVLAALIKF